METKNHLVLGIVVGLIIGFGLSYFAFNYLNKGNTFNDGLAFAKQRLAENYPVFNLAQNGEVKTISGVVKEVSGNTLTIKIDPIEPLASPDLDTRTVSINESTRIMVATIKSKATLDKEIAEYQKQIEEIAKAGKGDMPNTPEEYIQVVGNINDIGNHPVTISTNQDIRNQKSFTASEIVVQKI